MFQPRKAFLTGLLLFAVLAKLMPYILLQWGFRPDSDRMYPWSFSPIPALCLFGAALFRDRRTAYFMPLFAWFLGDVGILLLAARQFGWRTGLEWAFYPDQVVVYLSYGLIVTCGFFLRRNRSWTRIIGTGVVASSLFYLTTNFAVWACGDGTLYQKDLAGLMTCFAQGLIFYRNFVAGMIAFSVLLFSPLGVEALAAASDQAQPALDTSADPGSRASV